MPLFAIRPLLCASLLLALLRAGGDLRAVETLKITSDLSGALLPHGGKATFTAERVAPEEPDAPLPLQEVEWTFEVAGSSHPSAWGTYPPDTLIQNDPHAGFLDWWPYGEAITVRASVPGSELRGETTVTVGPPSWGSTLLPIDDLWSGGGGGGSGPTPFPELRAELVHRREPAEGPRWLEESRSNPDPDLPPESHGPVPGGGGGGRSTLLRPGPGFEPKGDPKPGRKQRRSQPATVEGADAGEGEGGGDARKPTKRARYQPGQGVPCDWPECGQNFSSRGSLKVHERSHTGEKPFLCLEPGCGKSYAHGTSLKSHMRKHTGEGPPHACEFPECGKAFNSSGMLVRHKRIHTGEKPFHCTVPGCGHRFARRETLESHMSSHTGVKPHVCTNAGCGKRFTLKRSLKSHMATQHAPAPVSDPAPELGQGGGTRP
jgi:hypothetical protein